MAETAVRGGGLRVFLSYARADGAGLADELFAGLALLGFEPMLDRHDIAAGEDWEKRLDGLIRASDTVLFLLSPHAVDSPRCRWEVEHALALSKRIVPVVAQAVPEADVPEPLRRLNYVFFDGGRSFARSLGQLADALRLDLGWIREHTRIAELSARWAELGHDESLLPRGAELAAALAWRQQWRSGAPEVNAAQRAYLDAAAEAEARRADAERVRNEQMAQANSAAAAALATREQALRRVRRLTIFGGAGGLLLSGGLAYTGHGALRSQQALELALQKTAEAERAKAEADQRSQDQAVEREAMRTDIVGQITAYAASPGEVILDESEFSMALVEQLDQQRASLWAALQQVSRHVQEKSGRTQRPFIASDMNGDLWYRRSPPTRRRRALLVSMDAAPGSFNGVPQSMDLPGVRRDAELWHRFLQSCGIPVQWLRNPARDTMQAALDSLKTAAVVVPQAWVRRAGVGPAASAAGAAVSTPPAFATRPTARADASPPAPPPNTFFTFVYIGFGYRIDGQDGLAAIDSRPDDPNLARALRSTLQVSEVSAWLRAHAACSCMVLDSNFASTNRPRR